MRMAIGLALIVLGVILLILGFNESQSFASDFTKFFTGNPTDKSMWLIIGGAVSAVLGAGVSFTPIGARRA